jgi:hypothetical protein
MDWKFEVGQKVYWETSGHGFVKRKGVVIAHLPAGSRILNVLPDIKRLSIKAYDKSSNDRYAIQVSRLNKSGVPVKSGATDVFFPNKRVLEKQGEIIG